MIILVFSDDLNQYSPEIFTPETPALTPASSLAVPLPEETLDKEDQVPVTQGMVLDERWQNPTIGARRQRVWPYPLVDTPNRVRAAYEALRRSDGRIPLNFIGGRPHPLPNIFSPSQVLASTPQRVVQALAEITSTTSQLYLTTNESLNKYRLVRSSEQSGGEAQPENRGSGYETQLSLFDKMFADISLVAFPYFDMYKEGEGYKDDSLILIV